MLFTKASTFSVIFYLSLLGLFGCIDSFPEYTPYSNWGASDAAVGVSMRVESEIPCNAVDDDQDGIIDEFVQTSCQEGTGICFGTGNLGCVLDNGQWQQTCIIPNQRTPEAEEVCDNPIDEDCDGSIDEGCVCVDEMMVPCYNGEVLTRGVGECRDGLQRCTESVFGECEDARLPTQEVCNGLDDNCNGQTDEGEMECATTCGTGVGICQLTGVGSGDYVVLNCSAPRPQNELCDNADNDCDGIVDEDVQTNDAACPSIQGCSVQQKCIDGALICDDTDPVDCLCERLLLGDGRHHLCRSPLLDHDRASQYCRGNGLGELVQLNSFAEYMSVFHGLKAMGVLEEVWVDGVRVDDTATLTDGSILDPLLFTEDDLNSANQRNRIALNTNTGLLHARGTTANRPFVCESPCDDFDTDQDLVTQCDGDCNAADINVNPSARETVGDGIDNNCNGVIDEIAPELCDDGVDNDGNGMVDEAGCMPNCVPFWRDDTMTLVCLQPMNWTDAVNYCGQYGLQLAEIRTFQDWRLLWVWFEASIVTPNRTNYWFGLRRAGDGFRYEQAGDVVSLDAPQWGRGQPDDYFGREDCAELWCDGRNECSGTWNDQNCDNARWFLCETVP
jgi:hypothetical protein